MPTRIFPLLASTALLIVPSARIARAQNYTERTRVTFNTQVEIPGHVVLPPGTYIFELQTTPVNNGQVTRLDRIQIFNEAQTKAFATLNTVPVELDKAPDRAIVIFSETPVGAPLKLHEFIFEGSTHGHEFVY